MRLFQALFRRKHMPNGHIYRGKDRIVKAVTISDMNKLRNQFAIEEENMFYLRHSFLTPEQSSGHSVALGKRDENTRKTLYKTKEFKDNVTIEGRLSHLRNCEVWD